MTYCSLEEAFSQPLNHNKKTKKINCNKHRTRFENYDNLSEPKNENIETFDNYNPGEMFEYNEESNRIIPEDSNIEEVADSISDSETEMLQNIKSVKKSRPSKKIKNKNNKNSLNPQINEINTKINFLINQIENKENEENSINSINNLDNNIHDIILFILFGIFVIVILEALFKLVNKIYRHNLIN
jgi:hypothetical protein